MTSTAAGARASTASPKRSGRDRTEPSVEPLLSLVRGWPWAIPLVLAGIVLRIVAVLGVRLFRYVDSGEYETLDFSGRWRRPWTTPLLYRVLPDDDTSIVLAQAFLGALCWITLAFAVAALVRRRPTQVVAAATTLALGCTTAITNWDSTMLSEPSALSLTALVLALWLNFVRRPTHGTAIGVVAATIPWLFVRQSLMPTAWLALGIVAVVLVVRLVRHRDLRAAVPQVIVVVGLLFSCIWATVSYGRNQEILHHNITTVVASRVAPNDEFRTWFVDRGMPLPADGRLDYGGFDEDDAFQDWVADEGTQVYARFLLTHPWWAVAEPVPEFLGTDRSFLEVPPYSDPLAEPVAMLAPSEPYGGARSVIPAPVEDVLLRGGEVGAIVFALVVVGGWAIVRRRDIDRRWAVPGATVVLAASSLYAGWHGATTELNRLGLPAAVSLRVAVIALVGLLVEAELDRRDARRRPDGPKTGAAYPRSG